MRFKGSSILKEIIEYTDREINDKPVPDMPELEVEVYVKYNGSEISSTVYQEIAKSSDSLKKAVAKRLRFSYTVFCLIEGRCVSRFIL